MSTSVLSLNNMSTITTGEYREREREREREHDQENPSDNTHARKKIRSAIQLPSPPPPTTMYTIDDQLTRTSPTPHLPTSILSSAPSSSSSIPAFMALTTTATTIGTTSVPNSPCLSTTGTKQKVVPPQQPFTPTQPQQVPQQQKPPPPSTPIYTIDDFITRFACKLQFLDYTIKTQMHKIETIKNDPSQDQKYRDLYLGMTNLEAKVRAIEDKIEDLFKLKIGNAN